MKTVLPVMSESGDDRIGSPVFDNEEEGAVGAEAGSSDRAVDDEISAGESDGESVDEVEEQPEKDDSLVSEVTRVGGKSDSDGESREGEEKADVELESSDERSPKGGVSPQSRGKEWVSSQPLAPPA